MDINVDQSSEIKERIKQCIYSNSVSDIQELINTLGPDKNNTEVCITQVYEECKLKNIAKEEVEFEIMKYLVKRRFETEKKKQTTTISNEELKERLKFTAQLIKDILEEHSRPKDDCDDDTFILISKFIAKNLRFLRNEKILEASFITLPWKEMEFCIFMFIHSSLQKSKTIYSVIIHKEKILTFLKVFLVEFNKIISEDTFKKPVKNWTREEIKNAVIKNNSDFRELYDAYDLMKSMYSLLRIFSYLEVATSVDLENDDLMGKLVLERALQVTGEYLKDTKETPNISDRVKRLLHQTGPYQLKNVLTKLRDSLSHVPSLTKRMELEADEDQTYFSSVLADIKKIQIEIRCILYFQKFNILLSYGEKSIQFIAEEFRQENDKLEEIFSKDCSEVIEILREIKQKYCSEETKDVNAIEAAIEKHEIVLLEMKLSYLKIIKEKYECEYNPSLSLDILRINLSNNNSELILHENRFTTEFILDKLLEVYNTILSKNPNNSRDIHDLFNKLFTLVFNQKQISGVNQMNEVVTKTLYSEKRKRVCDVLLQLEGSLNDKDKERVKAWKDIEKISYLVKVKKLLLAEDKEEIKDIMIKCGTSEDKVRALLESTKITKLKDEINKMNYFGTLFKKVEGFNTFSYKEDIKCLKQFLCKLKLETTVDKEIETLLGRNKSNTVNFFCIRLEQLNNIKDNLSYPKVELAMEMLILDLMEILDYTESLASNSYILETQPTLLIGKALRNYLAHGDALVDVLMGERTISDIVRANALELVKRGKDLIEQENRLVGQNLTPNITHAKELYKGHLNILKIQRNLFAATKYGEIAKFESYLGQGGDIFGVNTSGWSCAHFAAKGNKIELFRRLHNEGLY